MAAGKLMRFNKFPSIKGAPNLSASARRVLATITLRALIGSAQEDGESSQLPATSARR